jgi:hypothetical protein
VVIAKYIDNDFETGVIDLDGGTILIYITTYSNGGSRRLVLDWALLNSAYVYDESAELSSSIAYQTGELSDTSSSCVWILYIMTNRVPVLRVSWCIGTYWLNVAAVGRFSIWAGALRARQCPCIACVDACRFIPR